MKFAEDLVNSAFVIHSYDESGININQRLYTQSLVLSANRLIEDWPIQQIDQLEQSLLEPIIELDPEVIIIGTGPNLVFPHPQTYAWIINQGKSIEFMDTGAACRTYNVLLSEGRKVVAGFIL